MDRKFNKKLVERARSLRVNMTREERHLWYDFLNTYPVKFTRQKIIGNYIVDFYCSKAKLVVELDGSQHYEEENFEYDCVRSKFLSQYGLTVIRILNRDINDKFKDVCVYIDKIVKERL